jgi:hypothetical protein
MFSNASSFNQTVRLSPIAGTANQMFAGATAFNNGDTTDSGREPFHLLVTPTFTSAASMFAGCSSFNQEVTGLDALSGVTTTANMFSGAALFNNGDTANVGTKSMLFGTTAALTNASGMFNGCAAFNQEVVFSSMTGVTTLDSMFYQATVFNNGDVGNVAAHPLTFPTSPALVTLQSLFYHAENFNQTVVFQDVTQVTSFYQTFAFAFLFNDGNTTDVCTRPMHFGTTSTCNNTSFMFILTSLNQTITFQNLSGLSSSLYMFGGCPLFNNGDVGNNGAVPLVMAITSQLTDASYMFIGCGVFNQQLVFSDMSGVTTTESMFRDCVAFNNGDVTNASSKAIVWTLTSLQTAKGMFNNCSSLNQALTFSNLTSVKDASLMLSYCSSFKQDLSAWQLTSCTSLDQFFSIGDLNDPDSATNQNNYDALLTAWGALTLQPGVPFDMGATEYSAAGAAGRAQLTDVFGWTVNDRGEV